MTNHTLLYLAFEQMVIGVRLLQKKEWIKQLKGLDNPWSNKKNKVIDEIVEEKKHMKIVNEKRKLTILFRISMVYKNKYIHINCFI